MSVPFDICLLVSTLPAFRLRVEEQMHAFKAFKCSTNCCFFILMISLALPIVKVARVKMASVSICPIHVHCQSGLLPESKFIFHQQELCQSSQGANFMFKQKEAGHDLNTWASTADAILCGPYYCWNWENTWALLLKYSKRPFVLLQKHQVDLTFKAFKCFTHCGVGLLESCFGKSTQISILCNTAFHPIAF